MFKCATVHVNDVKNDEFTRSSFELPLKCDIEPYDNDDDDDNDINKQQQS